jgi:2-phospho-L-lactate guanylyltransferase (CobY/MobA/RfbA family)
MPSSFGPGSCERHLADAERAGVRGEVVPVPTLALDVDTAEDLDELEAALGSRHGGAANTRGMFLRLQRSRRHAEPPPARAGDR